MKSATPAGTVPFVSQDGARSSFPGTLRTDGRQFENGPATYFSGEDSLASNKADEFLP
jgi:hypothetical protein